MRPLRTAVAVPLVLVCSLAACAGPEPRTDTASSAVSAVSAAPTSTVPATSPLTVPPPSATTSDEPNGANEPPATAAAAETLCSYELTLLLGQVVNEQLDEASGLAASRRHPGVIWAHNDGGDDPGVFAVASDGSDLGFHPLVVDGAVDVEDMAVVSGASGDDLVLADIGDNGTDRPSIRLYRFAEPNPRIPAPITDVEVLEYTYPDRAHNAEVLLIDEMNDRIVIVTKQQRRLDGVPPELGPTDVSSIFDGPLSGHGAEPVELRALGTLDTLALEELSATAATNPISLLGFGGLPTGGDVSPDGNLIALRTYDTVWLFPRRSGETVADALSSTPCQVRVAAESQGEAVAFLDGTIITLSEGVGEYLYRVAP